MQLHGRKSLRAVHVSRTKPMRAKETDMTTTSSSAITFDRFETQPIARTWRNDRSTRHNTVTDPYTGKTLVTIPLATTQDVDDA